MENKLKTVLNNVVALTQQNEEFRSELLKALGVGSISNDSRPSLDEGRLKRIEKYLGLDYSVDSQKSLVDYGFVDDEEVRKTLEADNREMMRFRYGTRAHKTDFNEFCRYAQLQAEMLLNYYYSKRNNSTLSEIKSHILSFNRDANLDHVQSLAAIPYYMKVFSFSCEFKSAGFPFSLWNNVRQVRNGLSHRSTEKSSMQLEEYRDKLVSLNLPLKSDWTVNWFEVQKNEEIKKVYAEKVDKTPAYNNYCFLLWSSRQPFDEVVDALKKLAKIISNQFA